MARKRKAARQPEEPTGPREYNRADARVGPVTTYEDLADSEDEYFINKDKIMLEDEPRIKRQRREDEFLEQSDEEVLDYDNDSDDVDDEEDEDDAAEGELEAGDGDEEEDQGYWGSSRKEYYGNHDKDIQTEADALEEEAEALRLQKKKLSKMADEDFIFDEDEWLAAEDDAADGDEVVTEQLKDADINVDELTPEEQSALVRSRYPELGPLCEELVQLYPQLDSLRDQAEGKPTKSVEVVKWWIAGCYVSSLLSYFSILTAPTRDGTGSKKLLDPAQLREHEVMEVLVGCRETWQKVKNLHSAEDVKAVMEDDETPVSDSEDEAVLEIQKQVVKRDRKADKKAKQKKKAEAAKAKELEESLADLANLTSKPRKSKASAAKPVVFRDDHSDFGEEEVLDDRAAAEKAQRKKSLRFYTSQVVQKANKRAAAGANAGGDDDIPYRERFRDRQERLMREAERRGLNGKGAELGDGDSDDDEAPTNAQKGASDDEYYDMVANASKSKKADKAARADALALAGKDGEVIEREVVGADGKRKITYEIQKNKGLTTKRKKENRNGRVKKRNKYEKQMKKLTSMKAVYKGGEGKTGYQGETTGIKTGLVKSIKL